jgi:hypothetical protein
MFVRARLWIPACAGKTYSPVPHPRHPIPDTRHPIPDTRYPNPPVQQHGRACIMIANPTYTYPARSKQL